MFGVVGWVLGGPLHSGTHLLLLIEPWWGFSRVEPAALAPLQLSSLVLLAVSDLFVWGSIDELGWLCSMVWQLRSGGFGCSVLCP